MNDDTGLDGFVRVARAIDIAPGTARKITLHGKDIALWHVGNLFYAVDNVCPHQHFSSLHQGVIDGLLLTCPMHGWTYSLETGRATAGSGRVRTYRVEVVGGDVMIESHDDGTSDGPE